MQTVPSGWTAEERDSFRSIAQNTRVSWKKDNLLLNRTFTIGVSTIGGNDLIGINPGAIGSPANYRYFDESAYVTGLSWERALNMPTGGLTKAMANIELDNTSGRFTPRFMGGSSELFTAILPRRPVSISAGFNYAGINQTLPQFSGITTKQPRVDARSRRVSMQAADYLDYFQNRYIDHTVMFTSQFTDQVMADVLSDLGMSTAQYDLDRGINLIPFGLFETGTRLAEIFGKLAEAENGHFYQDEQGVFRFENRQHWDSSPFNAVQRIVLTGQVIEAEAPDEDHLVNVVEIRSNKRSKQVEQTIFRLNTSDAVVLLAGQTTEIFIKFDDPVLSMVTPTTTGEDSYYIANAAEDGSGVDLSSAIIVERIDRFATSAKFQFRNSGSATAYLVEMVLAGRPAKVEREVYYREQDDSSVTAYEERPLSIENDYIDSAWAPSYARMILNDFSAIENIQRITIRALPELQLGDLISWQGRYWRVYGMRTSLAPSGGFIQELTLLQRTITTYFRIGVSTIGGTDRIAP